MKTLENSQDKIEKICETLRKETLEPAQQEAARIIDEAKKQAEKIIHEAWQEHKKILADAKTQMEQERNVFQSSLMQASKQSVESLRQEIERQLFNKHLDLLLEKELKDPKIIASLISAIVKAIEKEGLDADLQAVVSREIDPRTINELIAKDALNKLKGQSVALGSIKGGAQVKIVDRNMTVDISENALKELIASFVRKDFRKLIFNE